MVNHEPTRQLLEDTPARVLHFLRGVGTTPSIRTILEANGYTDAEHAAGWTLLHKASGFTTPRTVPGIELDRDVQQAIVDLAAWSKANFERIAAALERRFPDQAAFVFDNLEPAEGAGSVLSVSTLLERLVALDGDPERKATRKPDHAAIELLGKRGYTKEERSRLRGLVDLAQQGTHTVAETGPDAEREKKRTERTATLRELYYWYKDWAATARSVFKRRDYLIRVGLVKRRKAEKSTGPASGATPAGAGSGPSPSPSPNTPPSAPGPSTP